MTMLFYGRKEVEVYTYIFPDNDGSGNLENLLIDTAKIVYPQLLDFAEEYVGKAATIQTTLMREQDKNKAIVGCITNVMKPGKANQVSIADNDWVSERTIEESETYQDIFRLPDMKVTVKATGRISMRGKRQIREQRLI